MRRISSMAHERVATVAAGLVLVCLVVIAACDGQPDRTALPSTTSHDSPNSSDSPGAGHWLIDRELPRNYREDCGELYRADEIGIPIDHSRQELTNTSYSGPHPCASFYSAEVQDVVFRHFSGTLALFRGATLRRVTFTRSRLQMSDFSGATLRDVEFRSVNLFGANFVNAKLRNVTLVNVVCPSGLNSADNNDSCYGIGFDPPDNSKPAWATPIRVSVPSHCGVLSVWVRGELWLADPPLGDHNPPPGWGENETSGTFVVTREGVGTFRGDAGQEADFRLADQGTADPNEGCE